MVALGLLGQQHGLDVGQDAALRDGHAAQQLVELLVVADGQLQVARDDARLLVVAGRVARQLQDLGRQVLQHGRQVHRGAGAHALRVVAFAEQPVHAAHGELQAGPGGAGLGLREGELPFAEVKISGKGKLKTGQMNSYSEQRRLEKKLGEKLTADLAEAAGRLQEEHGIDMTNSFISLGGQDRELYGIYQGQPDAYNGKVQQVFQVEVSMLNWE